MHRKPEQNGKVTMASICNDADGKKRCLFVDVDGKRKTIRLGKCSKSVAEKVKTRVESLLSGKILVQGSIVTMPNG